jgi:hypothetical protein
MIKYLVNAEYVHEISRNFCTEFQENLRYHVLVHAFFVFCEVKYREKCFLALSL